MAEKFTDAEVAASALRKVFRQKFNVLVDDVIALQNADPQSGIEWIPGNTRSRVEAIVAGRVRTLVLRSGGSLTVDPAGTSGAANWRVDADFAILTAALGPYLAIGTVVFYERSVYEMRAAYSSLPTGVTDARWRLIAGPESTAATPPPAAPTNLTATRRSSPDTTVDVSWTAPSSATGLTGYRVTVDGAQVYEGASTSVVVENASTDQLEVSVVSYGPGGASTAVTVAVAAVQAGETLPAPATAGNTTVRPTVDSTSVPTDGNRTKRDIFLSTKNGQPSGTTFETRVNGVTYPSTGGYVQAQGLTVGDTYTIYVRAVLGDEHSGDSTATFTA